MTKEQIATMMARRDEAWRLRNATMLAADYAEHCILESPTAGTVVGREAVHNVYKLWLTAFPDLTLQHEDFIIEDDRVAQTFTVWGTDTGGFLGFPPTGTPFRFPGVFLFWLKDGQIVRDRRIYDRGSLLLQLATKADGPIEIGRLYRETIERARLEQEIKIAAVIQDALLPERHRRCAHFEAAASTVPCRAIGGDFFDHFDLPGGRFGLAVGDVAGKGPPAALLMAMVQGMLAAWADVGGTPAQVLEHVNRSLVRRAIESRFATVFYAVLSDDGRLTYCNAGHNPPLLVRRSGIHRLETGGLIIGSFSDVLLEEETVQLDPGDTLVVFSDGLTEAFNASDEEFGVERLECCVDAHRELPAQELLDCVVAAVRDFTQGAAPSDDLTVFVLRYFGPSTVAA